MTERSIEFRSSTPAIELFHLNSNSPLTSRDRSIEIRHKKQGERERESERKKGKTTRVRKSDTKMSIPTSSCLSPTELRNPASNSLSSMKTLSSIDLMLNEEIAALNTIKRKHCGNLCLLVDMVSQALQSGGRLIYVGAGSSGRLAKMDCIEVTATFGTSSSLVSCLLAGGDAASLMPVDEAEDTYDAGRDAMTLLDVSHGDMVLAISASGQTPFVWGALAVAQEHLATTSLLTFNPFLQLTAPDFHFTPDLVLAIDVGPEVLTGSTRLKCGTATKCILDIVSTIAMVRMNRTKDNLMIYAHSANDKLKGRAARAFRTLHPNVSEEYARSLLEETNYDLLLADARLLALDDST